MIGGLAKYRGLQFAKRNVNVANLLEFFFLCEERHTNLFFPNDVFRTAAKKHFFYLYFSQAEI